MIKFLKITFFVLLINLIFIWGIMVGLYKWFPYKQLSWLKTISFDDQNNPLLPNKLNLNIEIKAKNTSELLTLRKNLLNAIVPNKEIHVSTKRDKNEIIYSVKYYGINVESRLHKVKKKKTCLIIYIQGHDGNPLLFSYHNQIKKNTEGECDFLSMSMLGLGLNIGNSTFPTHFGEFILNKKQSKNHALYSHFYDKQDTRLDPLSLFLYPHIKTIKQTIDDHKYKDVKLMGISGGGWYVVWLAALMPEIKKSISYAGSLPMEYRKFRENEGDWEQTGSNLYKKTSYFDLYQLMLINEDGSKIRDGILIYNSNDSCCFMNPYASHFKNLINNDPRFPSIIIDDSNTHTMRPELIFEILK